MHFCGLRTKFQTWIPLCTTMGDPVLGFQTIYGLPKGRQLQSMSMCQSMEMICSVTLPLEARNSTLHFAKGPVGEIIKLTPDKRSASLELVLKSAQIILYPLTLKGIVVSTSLLKH